MKLIQKQYKADKIIEILKTSQFFIAQQGNIDSQKWVNLKQEFEKENIKIYKLHNNLVKKLYSQSKFFNLSNFIQGPLIIGYSKNIYYSDKIIKLLENFTILCLKDNYKFYTPKEIKSAFLNSNNINININLVLELVKVLTLFSYCLTKKVKEF